MGIVDRQRKYGVLIAFEGLSSSGKSGCVDKLADCLRVNGSTVVIAKWNSVNFIRGLINVLDRIGLLTPKGYSILQWKSFLISYYTCIYPQLKKGNIVLADRYIYTAYTRDRMNGINGGFTDRLYRFAKKPDFIFFFETPPEVCYARAKNKGKQIFHLCGRIRDSRSMKNKDLHYLQELYEIYRLLFSDKKLTDGAKMIPVGEDDNNTTTILGKLNAVNAGNPMWENRNDY